MIHVGIVDDHKLFVTSLSLLVNSFGGFQTVLETYSGDLLLSRLGQADPLPDIILIDVNMPGRDGISTAGIISSKYPGIKLVALSMNDDDLTIINMIKAGCCAYLLKGVHPTELEKALEEIQKRGYYNADAVNLNYRRLLHPDPPPAQRLSERERRFVELSCSEYTYKEIAGRMGVSERTVEGYRESVFLKLNVQTRVGMVMEALKTGLVSAGFMGW